MRDVLATLLLAVLTVVGGAPAAADAVPPPRVFTGHTPASVTSPAPAPAPATDAVRRAEGSGVQALPAIAPPTPSVSAPPRPPGLLPEAGVPEAARVDGAGWWAEAVPVPAPRAGAGRPHAPHHFPPPAHGALPPRTPGLLVPTTVHRGPAGAAVLVPGRTGAALPGVRGPPGCGAGQPAPHRSCSTDPSSRVL
ncbi:hypothetical protein [Streptomyces griseus]|uniref:hypothetical protein n=1 Tax=Streptomyces griseus TaxID=1911 RepID=UPI0008405E1D|nr:hypothetical protein [Streptomyces griseus]